MKTALSQVDGLEPRRPLSQNSLELKKHRVEKTREAVSVLTDKLTWF
jgi:hypothetical protein